MIKRYGFGREHANRVGCPAIIELPDGEYVRHADYLAALAKVEAMAATQTVTIAELREAQPDAQDGWKLVPVVPTAEMVLASFKDTKPRNIDRFFNHRSSIYLRMVEAAPHPTSRRAG